MPVRDLHTEIETHLRKPFLDLPERPPAEIWRPQHFGFRLLYEFADEGDVVVLQTVSRPDRKLKLINSLKQMRCYVWGGRPTLDRHAKLQSKRYQPIPYLGECRKVEVG